MSSRRVAWNSTLLLSGIFGIVAGAMPTFVSFVSIRWSRFSCTTIN